MKKRIVTFLIILGMVLLNQPIVNVFAAEQVSQVVFEDPDQIFESTIKEIKKVKDSYFQFEKRELYDINLNECGYFYTFSIFVSEGYALVLGTSTTGFTVEEIYFNSVNPFESELELPVYVAPMTLYSFCNGVYRDARTNEVVLSLVEYQGVAIVEQDFEEITYTRKTSSQTSLAYGVPFYCAGLKTDNCACVAGSIVLGYYDRIYPNIISGFEAYDTVNNVYRGGSEQTQTACDQLYVDMSTDINHSTSFADFIIGMEVYLARKDRDLSYTNVLSSGVLDYNKMTTAISQQRPIVVFVANFTIVDDYGTVNYTDKFFVTKYTGGHVMVVYGFKDITYYTNSTTSVWSPVWYNPFRYIQVTTEVVYRNDSYLNVSSGIGFYEDVMLRLNQDDEYIDYAVSLNVY